MIFSGELENELQKVRLKTHTAGNSSPSNPRNEHEIVHHLKCCYSRTYSIQKGLQNAALMKMCCTAEPIINIVQLNSMIQWLCISVIQATHYTILSISQKLHRAVWICVDKNTRHAIDSYTNQRHSFYGPAEASISKNCWKKCQKKTVKKKTDNFFHKVLRLRLILHLRNFFSPILWGPKKISSLPLGLKNLIRPRPRLIHVIHGNPPRMT